MCGIQNYISNQGSHIIWEKIVFFTEEMMHVVSTKKANHLFKKFLLFYTLMHWVFYLFLGEFCSLAKGLLLTPPFLQQIHVIIYGCKQMFLMVEMLGSVSLVVFIQKPIQMVINLIMLEMWRYSLHSMQQLHPMFTFPVRCFVITFPVLFICFSVLKLPWLNGLIIFNWQLIVCRNNWVTFPVTA